MTPEPDAAALEAYEEAYARVQLARVRWSEAGSPLTLLLPNGCEVKAPLWRALLEAEAWFEKCRQQVRVIKPRGPRPVAVIEGAIGASPAARLRAVTEKDA